MSCICEWPFWAGHHPLCAPETPEYGLLSNEALMTCVQDAVYEGEPEWSE